MVPCLDAGLDLIKEVHIGVPCEDHAAGAVVDAVISSSSRPVSVY